MQNKFEESLRVFFENKKKCPIFDSGKYDRILITLAKNPNAEIFTPEERVWITKYGSRVENGTNVLYRSRKKVVKKEELFNILNDAHQSTGHGGRDTIWNALKERELIFEYVKLCEECELKKSKAKKSVVVKPILSQARNSRCQVDLIDFQSRPDGDFKFLMVYQDHLTKFVILRALKTKTAIEVSQQLADIFCTFGAPKILQSDNGREFANRVINELARNWKWGKCKVVHGKPRHSQSQGSVERANRDIGDIVTIFLREHKTECWAKALPFIQMTKNNRYHRGIGQTPFAAMFGREVGEDEIVNEEYWMTEFEDGNEEPFIDIDGNDWLEDVSDRYVPEYDNEMSATSDELSNLLLDERNNTITHNREVAALSQQSQAEKMLEMSSKRLAPAEVGQNVRLRVEDVDRSKIDHRNLLGIVLNKDNDYYKIGTRHGELECAYSRNQFELSTSQFMTMEDVPEKQLSFRAAVGASSISGLKQGMLMCNCMGSCEMKRCKCVREGRLCTSRCHSSRSCKNK